MHLLFLVADDRYFVSHRLHLAVRAKEQGYRVAVLCGAGHADDSIRAAGVELFSWPVVRGSLNPWSEIRALWAVVKVFRQFRPELIHAVAIKPVIYAALAAKATGVPGKVYALGGLGFIFGSGKRLARMLRPVVLSLFRWIFRQPGARLILQNPDDRKLLQDAGVASGDGVHLIRGAGVDTARFRPTPEPEGQPLVVLPARLLWSKGLREFVEASRMLKARGRQVRFALVGEPDPHNPESVPVTQVDTWVAEGVVEAWGHRQDMPEVLSQAAIVCLPSHREGLPKSLLEAASCGRPIVTFDVPGCREVVTHGENGCLVPLGDVVGLADAMDGLLANPQERARMGQAGREKALREFSQEHVADRTAEVWRDLAVAVSGRGVTS